MLCKNHENNGFLQAKNLHTVCGKNVLASPLRSLDGYNFYIVRKLQDFQHQNQQRLNFCSKCFGKSKSLI